MTLTALCVVSPEPLTDSIDNVHLFQSTGDVMFPVGLQVVLAAKRQFELQRSVEFDQVAVVATTDARIIRKVLRSISAYPPRNGSVVLPFTTQSTPERERFFAYDVFEYGYIAGSSYDVDKLRGFRWFVADYQYPHLPMGMILCHYMGMVGLNYENRSLS